ncbi:MAG: 30S ribosomal protein S20 [Alphaproteobacteria bacterium]|nr:MAG: 30S ribosomal protein S20 [Alphaproteobacteria bacterium]
MANHASAIKRVRQTARRRLRNRAHLSRIRTAVKKVETSLQSGQLDAALEAFRQAEPELARGVSKGVLHRNTASRKISRLCSRIKALKTPAAQA